MIRNNPLGLKPSTFDYGTEPPQDDVARIGWHGPQSAAEERRWREHVERLCSYFNTKPGRRKHEPSWTMPRIVVESDMVFLEDFEYHPSW